MKKITATVLLFFALYLNSTAQLYFTKNGYLSFFSSTQMEDIKATNNQVIGILNTVTGDIQFSLLNNAFRFKKALMEEHFNENYMESSKYPKSVFKGIISNLKDVTLSRDGVYNITVSGNLSIHGVTRSVSVPGKLTVKAGNISASSGFNIKPGDYNIRIPASVKNNIAERVEVTINCNYEKKN